MTNRFVAFWMAAGLGIAATGCGSGSSALTGASQAAPGAPPAVAGATIRGTVQTGVAASSTGGVRALAAAEGVRVSVVGTSLSTLTDPSGQFELHGLSAGRARLHFEASGIQAELEIEGLEDGHATNVEVHLSSDGAFLSDTDDHRGETSLRGRIDAITGSRLQVQGRLVQTDGLTEFLDHGGQPTSIEALRVGDSVEIEGASQSDGSVYARKVKLEDADENEPPQNENEVQFSGGIQSLNPFRVAGRVVEVDASTQILDHKNVAIPFSALGVGNTVEVEGAGQSDGSVLARKVRLDG